MLLKSLNILLSMQKINPLSMLSHRNYLMIGQKEYDTIYWTNQACCYNDHTLKNRGEMF